MNQRGNPAAPNRRNDYEAFFRWVREEMERRRFEQAESTKFINCPGCGKLCGTKGHDSNLCVECRRRLLFIKHHGIWQASLGIAEDDMLGFGYTEEEAIADLVKQLKGSW